MSWRPVCSLSCHAPDLPTAAAWPSVAAMVTGRASVQAIRLNMHSRVADILIISNP